MSTTELQLKSEKQGTEIHIEKWGWASIAVNVGLTLLNLAIAIPSGSLAVAAEMVHNLVDLVASIAVLLGLKISQRHSKTFPYGLYKVENVVAVGVAMLIFFTGFEIVSEALFSSQQPGFISPWMLVGVAISALLPFTFSHFELRAGREANSPSLIADAQEYRAHVFSSGVVLISLIGQSVGLQLDRPAALLVVFFIARTGWELLKDGMRVLLDASLDAQTLGQVRRIIEDDPATIRIKALTGRNSGRYRFLEAEVMLRVGDLEKAHMVSQRIEQSILAEVPHVERVLIHYEPAARTHLRLALPLADSDGKLSEHFGEAPFFAIVSVQLSDGMVEKKEVLTNPHQQLSKAKGIRVAEWLVAQKVDRVVIKESLQGKGPEYVFADAGVEMFPSEAGTLSQVLDELGIQN